MTARPGSPLQLPYEIGAGINQDICDNGSIILPIELLQLSDGQEVSLHPVDDNDEQNFISSVSSSFMPQQHQQMFQSVLINAQNYGKSVIINPNEFLKSSHGKEKIILTNIEEDDASTLIFPKEDQLPAQVIQIKEGDKLPDTNEDFSNPNIVLTRDYNLESKEDVTPQYTTLNIVDGQYGHVLISSCDNNGATIESHAEVQDDNPTTSIISISEEKQLPSRNEDLINEDSSKGPWKCTKCKVYLTKYNLYKQHVRRHLLDKPFQCDLCEESFNVEKNLNLHSAIHDPFKLVCRECDKEFRRLASFKAHIAIHQDDETVSCEICHEEFVSIQQLEPHRLKHTELSTKESKAKPILPTPLQCHHCGIKFTKPDLLKHHLTLHKKNKFLASRPKKFKKPTAKTDSKCNICHKYFMKPSVLVRHMRTHTGERPYKCNYVGCGRAFNQKTTLIVHENIHTGSKHYKCDFCGKMFIQKSNLKEHIRRVHPSNRGDEQLYECHVCTCVFKRAGSLNAHFTRVHLAQLPLIDESKIQEHLQQIQNNSLSNNNNENSNNLLQSFTLENQGIIKTDKTDNDLLQQVLNKTGLDQAKSDAKSKMNPKDENSDENTPSVWVSSEVTPSRTEMNGSQVTIDQVENNPSSISSDVDEKGSFGNVAIIDRMIEGSLRRCPVLVNIRGDTKIYVCPQKDCRAEFKKPSDLVRHSRIHTKERPFKCPKCFRAFAIKSTMRCHYKTHLPLQQYSCTTCSKKFPTSTSLKIHERRHTDTKAFLCPKCPKSFRTMTQRKNHILTHNHPSSRNKTNKMPLPDIPLQEPILITDKGLFKQQSRHHQVYVTESGEPPPDRPHRCTYCTASFKKSSHLKQHERTHTGEKPYKCEKCGKLFNSPSALKVHQRTHVFSKTHKCHICKKSFASSSSLSRHMFIHSDKRPYMCPYCRKQFKTNTNCKKHMKIHKHELAMDAVRAAGPNLKVDSQKASLTANLYRENRLDESSYSINNVPAINISNHSEIVCDNYSGFFQTEDPSVINISQDNMSQDTVDSRFEVAIRKTLADNGFILNDLLKNTGNSILVPGQNTQMGMISSSNDPITVISKNDNNPSTSNEKFFILPNNVLQDSNQNDSLTILGSHSLSESNQPLNMENCSQPMPRFLDSSSEIKLISISNAMGQDQRLSQIHLSNTNDQLSKIELDETHDKNYQNEQKKINNKLDDVTSKCMDPTRNNLLYSEEGDISEQIISLQMPLAEIFDGTSCVPLDISNNGREVNAKKIHSDYTIHHERNIPETVKSLHRCKDCGKAFSTAMELDSHCHVHQIYKCSDCSHTCSNMAQLKNHIKSFHPKEFNCTKCDSKFKSDEQLVQHHLSNHVEINCVDITNQSSLPSEMVLDLDPLNIKMEAKSPVQAESPLLLVNENDKLLPTIQDNQKHLQKKTVQNLKQPSYQNQCKHCVKSFKKLSDLTRHIRTHTGEKPFKCSLCTKCFAVKSALNVHMKTHSGKREYKCPECQTYYSSKGSMNMHMRLHTGYKPLKCPLCPMTFRTSGHRKVHIMKHNQDNDNQDAPSVQNQSVVKEEPPQTISVDASNLESLISQGVMLQLNLSNHGQILDPEAILNLPNVTIDSSDISECQNPDDTISVDPNIIMAHPRDVNNDGNSQNFEIFLNNGKLFAAPTVSSVSQSLGKPSNNEIALLDQAMLSDVIINDPSTSETPLLKCAFCSKVSDTEAEFQEHMSSHNISIVKMLDNGSNLENDEEYIVPQNISSVASGNQHLFVVKREMPSIIPDSGNQLKTIQDQIFNEEEISQHILSNKLNYDLS